MIEIIVKSVILYFMNHKDHMALIEKAVHKPLGIWADLGSGAGAFTLALRDMAGPEVEIYSVDKYAPSLDDQEKAFEEMFPGSKIHYLHMDFTEDMPLPLLDGILMANSLHFLKDQDKYLLKLHRYLKPNGTLLLVEYNASEGNAWVPYPISFEKFEMLAEKTGYEKPKFLKSIPSHFLNEIYSAVTKLE